MDTTTLILTQQDVARLVDIRSSIKAVHRAFVQQAQGQAQMPSKLYLQLPKGDFRAMPAALFHPSSVGLKFVNVHPGNRKLGLPTVMAVMLLNDPATGRPLAIMDGLLITKLRTAAAAAVAADVLSRRDSRVVGLIGCGAQADAQMLALAAVRKLSEARVWGFVKGEAARFCAVMKRQLSKIRWQPVETIRDAARDADILVTLTPSRKPLVKSEWVADGTHINAVGADGPGKQELDVKLLRRAKVFVDDRDQAIHGGELNIPISRGQFNPRDIHAVLGQVLAAKASGRRSAREITLFDSTGLAIHDVALAQVVYQQALKRRMGRKIQIFSP